MKTLEDDAAIVIAGRQAFTEAEAAKFLGVAKGTLQVWRSTGRQKIPYLKLGSLVKYFQSDLEEWIESQMRTKSSTGEVK